MDKLVRKTKISLARKAMKEAGLYVAGKKDFGRLARAAADAYVNYPLHNWLFNGTYDAKTSRLLMEASLNAMAKDAIVCADSEEMNGFVAWFPAGFSGNKTLPFLFGGGFSLIAHAGFGIIKRLVIYDEYAMGLKKELTGHNDWYLFNLSVKKDAQGKGIATKLLTPMLQFCDEERTVAYLETNKDENVAIYQHYGFDLMSEGLVPTSSVRHYAMVRRPKGEDN